MRIISRSDRGPERCSPRMPQRGFRLLEVSKIQGVRKATLDPKPAAAKPRKFRCSIDALAAPVGMRTGAERSCLLGVPSYFPAQNWCFGKSGQGRAATQDPPGATGGGFYRA